MNKNKNIIYMAVISIIFFTGCANMVKYKFESTPRETATDGSYTTIAYLSLNWRDYDIYYSGITTTQAKGILFDPKNDDINLVPEGDEWSKVTYRETYDKLIKWHAGPTEIDGRLFRILKPDDQFVGYLFLIINELYTGARIVDENTIIFLPIWDSENLTIWR